VTSVRRALLLTLLAAVAAVTAASALATYRVARRELDQVFDYHLRQIALSLREQVRASVPRPVVGAPGDLDFAIQIWDADGNRVYASRPGISLPEVNVLGYGTVAARGGPWRVYSTEIGDYAIQVAQPLAVREQRAFAASVRTLAPVLLLVPLLAVAVWWIVGRGLAPLDRLARAVARRTSTSLEPFSEARVPEEVLPLVRSLNALVARLAAAFAAQRALVADAAHELRTPLAALRLQAQLAEGAPDASGRGAALGELRAGVERATHVVEQLLTLARQEHEGEAASTDTPVRLADLVAQAVADHAALAEAKGVDLGAARLDEVATVRGDPAGVRALLANLVDNAIRYTPGGGRVDVSAFAAPGGAALEVADTGPGVPPAERARVFDRFYRLPGTAEPGSGLGLAIVKAVADRHGARVELRDTRGGGLTARVEFPRLHPDELPRP
jgi:two-component system OmpR family sensor kinase